ncbi:MAG: NosD domain-containing protein [Bacteroidota bacterium]
MKRCIILFTFSFLLSPFSFSQTIVPLTDNMEVASNSSIKIQPGSYAITDSAQNGIIRIINKENITIDGDSVEVTGPNYAGFLIYIENSRDINIKNFSSVSGYYYALSAKQSTGLSIYRNHFSYNKKDTTGWIYIWTDHTEALGGGVLMYRCDDSELYDNTMVQQNDGIAMYECDSIRIHDNLLNWNCGFGIRMNYTDHCTIRHNDCSHVNRITDPSDCAAILLIVSNNNTVEYNDLTYSGDGVFLGQYEYSNIPNNNFFGYNDCSYSPHNAIEATFADGNVYKGNRCNFSHYGFWLGYSFNSLIEDNEIIGNLQSGIAVDRGYSNTFRDNLIKENPYGFELWEGGVISPYGNQFSHDYYIYDNVIEGNIWGISAIKTEHLVARGNTFTRNKEDIYLEGESDHDTITGNAFHSPTLYYIHTASTDPVEAIRNSYVPMIDSLIRIRLSGNVNWLPYTWTDEPKVQDAPPCDMAERPGVWTIYADPGYGYRRDEILEWDYTDKKVGAASIKMYTPRGWEVGLNYRPSEDSLAVWNLTESDTLSFWVKTIKQPSYGFQAFHVRIGNTNQGYYEYTGQTSALNNANKVWKRYRIPIRGNSSFPRTTIGNMSLNNVNYVEFRADTWDFGYTLWLDGVQFKPCEPTGIDNEQVISKLASGSYPNPFTDETTIWFDLPEPGPVKLAIFDLNGRLVRTLIDRELPVGRHEATFTRENLTSGVFFYKLLTTGKTSFGKLLVE